MPGQWPGLASSLQWPQQCKSEPGLVLQQCLLTSSLSVPFLTEDGEYFLKVLIPSYAAGSIIGKGGQTIVQLQKETGATIKLSKSKDFYPGESGQLGI